MIVATFLAERYWPGVTPASAADATARLQASGADVVETVVAEADEVCYWYIEAESAAAVGGLFEAAAVTVDRIGTVQRVAADGQPVSLGTGRRRQTGGS